MLSRSVNRRIGRAMHTYGMLEDGDRVLVAVSGGVDSLVLAWLLQFWQRKAPISYRVHAVHIDMEPDSGGRAGTAALAVERQLRGIAVQCSIVPTVWQRPAPVVENQEFSENDPRDVCYTCARHRRTQLFAYARQEGFNKIALGHHRDDILETFFLNICFAGNISTMVPRQDLFEGRLALIRPLAFLDKDDILTLAGELRLEPVRTNCPLSEKTKRMEVRQVLADLYERIPESKKRIFSALSNVRQDYLLKASAGDHGVSRD
jgi:tRNA 2-thiocytidine biosynthesis protein TtcA